MLLFVKDLTKIIQDIVFSTGYSHSNKLSPKKKKSTRNQKSIDSQLLKSSGIDNPRSKKDWNELLDEELLDQTSILPTPPSIIVPVVKNLEIAEADDWLPSIPFEETEFDAIVTYVGLDGSIYLHHLALDPAVKDMEDNMKRYFDSVPPEPSGIVWTPGQMCTVRYHCNNLWYRGKILTVSGDEITVVMIDFGNVEVCTPNELRMKVLI